MKIYFPKRKKQQSDYNMYYTFFLNLLKSLNLDIELYDEEPSPGGSFIFRIDGKCIQIDYCDLLEPRERVKNIDAFFKFHYSESQCGHIENTHPLCPVSFHNWDHYFILRKYIEYKCKTDNILSNQRPHHGARKRRKRIQMWLEKRYGDMFDSAMTGQIAFWDKINKCLVSVCVPGCRGDILDKGQFQYMAFGACTISPKINLILPNMKEVEPGTHYIECNNRYSDLFEKIEWCRNHRNECVQIGRSSKKLFYENCTPNAIWQWINKKLTGDIDNA